MKFQEINEIAICTGLTIRQSGEQMANGSYTVSRNGQSFVARNLADLEQKVMALNTVLCIQWQ